MERTAFPLCLKRDVFIKFWTNGTTTTRHYKDADGMITHNCVRSSVLTLISFYFNSCSPLILLYFKVYFNLHQCL